MCSRCDELNLAFYTDRNNCAEVVKEQSGGELTQGSVPDVHIGYLSPLHCGSQCFPCHLLICPCNTYSGLDYDAKK